GSSPHARGAVEPGVAVRVGLGLIPARAGSGHRAGRRGWPRGAHPRTRGERCCTSWRTSGPSGSSPHARGAVDARHRGPPFRGLIPARAGSGRVPNATALLARAHPRTRGERRNATAGSARSPFEPRWGSSPHARGAVVDHEQISDECGLIPARAGSGSPRPRRRTASRAHPRTRGERLGVVPSTLHLAGSSPHARGAGNPGGCCHGVDGLIPARAGSGCPACPGWRRAWAHPRTRGERASARTSATPPPGSSPARAGSGSGGLASHRSPRAHPPHARGAAGGSTVEVLVGGLIPARAGSGAAWPARRPTPWAHPRTRGERAHVWGPGSPSAGSSPHARGAAFRPRATS
ncbi:LOW QUALITY PROTEIN: conserved hypothetical protein, partial [Streptomyces sp. SPB78]